MPVPIDVPGLDAFVREVPDGGLVLLEGGAAPAKGHLARRLGRAAANQGRPVAMWSTRDGDGEGTDGVAREELDAWPAEGPPAGHDLVVDSFSMLCLDASPTVVTQRVRDLRRACRDSGRIAVLVLEEGQLDAATRSACHHLADGVIQFLARDDPDGPVSYLRVPKWMQGGGVERNLFYGFDGRQMLIDTRRRVN